MIYGAKVGEGELLGDRVLAIDPGTVRTPIDGVETADPTYGLPARWVPTDQRSEAKSAGYTLVEPLSVLTTHLSETIKREAPNLLSRAETDRLINRMKSEDPGLVEELIPNVLSVTDIQKVLQGLLREKV